MAKTQPVFAAILCFFAILVSGCGHEARVAVRNTQIAGEVLATQGPDDLTRAMGRAIAEQSKASADQMDLLLWGLLARNTKATVTAQDWMDSPAAAERRSHEQAVKVERETERIQAIAGSFFESLGLASGLTGSGILGLLAAWALKNQRTLRLGLERAVLFAEKIKVAETDDDVKAVEDEHKLLPANPALKKALAKVKKTSKVS